MMHMFFWFGTKLKSFLFYGFDIGSTWGLISICLGLGALAILFEAMKIVQVQLNQVSKEYNNQESNPALSTADSSSLISRASERSTKALIPSCCNKQIRWIAEILHWSAHVTLGYFLMLAVMTFNGYISIAIILGSGIGYYIFGHILLEINMVKLQKHRRLIQCNPECADAVIETDRRESIASVVSESVEQVNVDVDVHIQG